MESNCRDMPLVCFNRNLYVLVAKNNEVLSSRQDPRRCNLFALICIDVFVYTWVIQNSVYGFGICLASFTNS